MTAIVYFIIGFVLTTIVINLGTMVRWLVDTTKKQSQYKIEKEMVLGSDIYYARDKERPGRFGIGSTSKTAIENCKQVNRRKPERSLPEDETKSHSLGWGWVFDVHEEKVKR